ncbi:zinc finger, CCHC-type, Retrotransposon gag domain protein [Artemisia annua]|uniref:Zinc finger, CCHC-type, Retrotransposon gag domain protein n=1 Tax=Artemisia annua TaxID=35608 RepID=A0A2U1N3U0_ARTAN|nr:zinc finger, CCHC-type, Retrotransposon gag domain protein [Artemisia annua]
MNPIDISFDSSSDSEDNGWGNYYPPGCPVRPWQTKEQACKKKHDTDAAEGPHWLSFFPLEDQMPWYNPNVPLGCYFPSKPPDDEEGPSEPAPEWWTKYVQIVGVDAAYSHSWEKLKRMMSLKFCVRSELRAMEQETLDFTMVGDDVDKYTTRFYELARLGPAMDEPESKKLERYIGGLSPEIRMLVISLEPDTMFKAVNMANVAKEYIAHTKTLGNNSDNKRKWLGEKLRIIYGRIPLYLIGANT